MQREPIYRRPAEGKTIAVAGDSYRFLATGEETGGKYAAWEATVPPGGGPPLHRHSREEESFYVLEGTIAFRLGEDKFTAEAGTFVNMPIGSWHTFKNETDRPARMIISVAPAGLETMFFETGLPARAGESPPPISPAEVERLLAAAPRYGVEIQPPPA